MLITGIENFTKSPPKWMKKSLRLGLLCNSASVGHNLYHARELIEKNFPGQLKALYSPQHGFYASKQDNMIESDNMTDPVLKIPVFSLYGKTRIPTSRMLEPIDILLIDLQDVGCRVYTFIYTMSYCLEAAKKAGKKVVILDRPNPITGTFIEGNCLSEECISFVGRYPIPMRHGLTIGELGVLFNKEFSIGCDLEVIPMKGWTKNSFFQNTGLPWIPPSPNLPSPRSAMVYPGQVLWEGTNISEGRGTTQPFEIFGAPFLDTDGILEEVGGRNQPGAILRSTSFEPVANKWAGCLCHGFQIHVTDPYQYKPYFTSLKLIRAVIKLHKDRFRWKSPPYEYEFNKMPIDLITGDIKIRKQLENLENVVKIEKTWQKGLTSFMAIRKNYLIYW